MQLELLPEEPKTGLFDPEAIAREVLGELNNGLIISNEMTSGRLHELWGEIIGRAGEVEARYGPKISELRAKREATGSKSEKREIAEQIHELEDQAKFASSICYITFEQAYVELSDRLATYATANGVNPDDFCERVNSVYVDPFYREATHKMTLLEVMQEVVKELKP